MDFGYFPQDPAEALSDPNQSLKSSLWEVCPDAGLGEFLGVLRTGDLPHNLALAYPRTITFVGKMPDAYSWTRRLYEKLGAGDRIRVIRSTREWRPE